jgi:Uma2 family endonuclease
VPVSERTYEQLALEDPEGKWELWCGELRRKPSMTAAHNQTARILGFWLQQQLPLDQFEVSVDAARARRPVTNSYIPDVMVIPAPYVERMQHEQPDALEAYMDPLPLVVEVWSPSTGEYDATEKLADYKQRGDAEIWLLRPGDRTLIAWVRRSDGAYVEQVYRGGIVRPSALPNVTIDLDALFDRRRS